MRQGQCDCPTPWPDNDALAAGIPLEEPLSLIQWRKNKPVVPMLTPGPPSPDWYHCAPQAILISFDVTVLPIVLIQV